jgi:hypothetical protein
MTVVSEDFSPLQREKRLVGLKDSLVFWKQIYIALKPNLRL